MADKKREAICWFSDGHVGYNQYGLHARKNDFMKAFVDVTHNILNSDVEVVLIGGDLFHGRSPDFETLQLVGDTFETLKNSNRTVVCILGNHDTDPNSYLDWIDYFGLTRPPYVYENILINGLDWVGLSLPKEIPSPDNTKKKNILMLHWGFHSQSNIGYDRLLSLKYDLILLGHIHKPYTIGNKIFSSGSLESTSTSEWFNKNGALYFDNDLKLVRTFEPTKRKRYRYSIDTDEDDISLPNSKKLKDAMVLFNLMGSNLKRMDEASAQIKELMELSTPLIFKIKKNIRYTDDDRFTKKLPIVREDEILKEVFGDDFNIISQILSNGLPDNLVDMI